MADNASLLRADDFTEEEIEKVEAVANGDIATWAKGIVLEAADYILANPQEPQPEADEPGEEEGQPEITAPMVVVDPAAESAMTMLAEIRQLQLELRVWQKTLLSELYAHTGFASPEQERLARRKAEEKFALVEKSVQAELKRTDGAVH